VNREKVIKEGGNHRMITKIILALMLISVVTLTAIGCGGGSDGGTSAGNVSGPTSTPSGGGNTGGIVRPTWVDAQVNGDAVSISATGVDSGKMLHFRVTDGGTSMAFMVYKLDGERYVRANVCPPCRSVGFSLSGDILVCNSCGTRFEASTGDGISGACRDYPKAEVAHVVSGDNLTMDIDDLVTAYQNTQQAG